MEKQINIINGVQKEEPESFKIIITDYDLSVRAFNICRFADIHTIKDLVKTTKEGLYKIRNCGKKTISELENLLHDLGLEFDIKSNTLKTYKHEDKIIVTQENNKLIGLFDCDGKFQIMGSEDEYYKYEDEIREMWKMETEPSNQKLNT